MKQKEKQSAKSMTIEEIGGMVIDMKKKLAEYKRNRYTKPSKNSREGKLMRIRIAQLLTLKREKELQSKI